jgi:matrixin
MMTRTFRTGLVAVCALAVNAAAARADIGPRWSDDQLATKASAIVSGRVAAIGTGRDAGTGAIHTYVTIGVDRVFKGDIPERDITVKQLGGRIGTDTLVVFGQAEFVAGEDVLLFLATRQRDRTLMTAALWQGKWTIERDAASGEAIATRREPELADRGALRGEAERRSLGAFTSRLEALGAAARTSNPRRFAVQPSADEMRGVVLSSRNALPFTQLGPARWNEFDSRTSIPVDTQSSGQPGLGGGGFTELGRARSAWGDAAGLLFGGGGNTNKCFGAGPFDGRISITFDDRCGDIDDDQSIIAIGGFQSTSSGGRTVNGVGFSRIVAGYYVTNDAPDVQDLLHNSGCFQFVATHEIGHVLGMGHSSDPGAVMFPSVALSRCSGGSPGLNADDVTGIRFIYPGASSTPTAAPGAPTNLAAAAFGSTVSLTWTAPTAGGSPTAYIIEAGSAPGLSNLANFSTGNTATTFQAGGVGTGIYYVRVKAANGSGTSAASNESILTVGGGCTAPPPAPPNFTLVFNSGGTVSFAWGASTNAISYIIEAGSVPGASNLANANLGSSATTATFGGVGRGTYFVRLRATNICGPSGPSNEVTVVVQ